MKGISNYVSETNHISRKHSVARDFQLLFMVLVTLFAM
jgi:hypothetical protein